MRLIGLAVVLAISLTHALLAAEAQPRHVPRLGVLSIDAIMSPRHVAFLDELRSLGYLEGRTITIEYRWAEGRQDRLPTLAAELVALPVDILVTTGGAPVVRAAKQATTSIPIVAMIMNEPVETGLVSSLARPGGNVTGHAFEASALSTKQLELLRETVPQLARVAVLWYEGGNQEAGTVRAAQDAARALRIQLQAYEVREPADIVGAVAAAKAWGAQALLQIPSPFFFHQRTTLVALLTAHRIPAMCESRPLVVQGCLMTYAPSFEAMARRTAYYVDRILKGAKPADLPVEQPTKFELVINLKTAKALGLTIPQSVLGRADQIIE
jgi:putative tryptophan/tyrosine transport system substrate-binding protein